MPFLTRITSILGLIRFAAQRLWRRRLFTLCFLLGMLAAVTNLAAIPLYAEAVQNRLLQGQLTATGAQLPPFSFLWRYVGAWNGDLARPSYLPAHTYLTEQAPPSLSLPLQHQVHHVQTPRLRLFPAPETQAFAADRPLLWASVGFATGLQEHVQLLEGAYPAAMEGDAVPVLASHALAAETGLQVGERYLLLPPADGARQIALRIAGIWQPRDAGSDYWFYPPDAFHDVLLTAEAHFVQGVAPQLDAPISQAVWYQVYDGERVRAAGVAPLLNRVRLVEARLTAFLDGAALDASPVLALQAYRREARRLTLVLTIYSLPVVALVATFIYLIAALTVQRDENEIAVLRSRGVGRGQVLGIYFLEWALVSGLALPSGMLLATAVARLMGRTRDFLLFDARLPPLAILVTPAAWRYALGALVLALLALLIPVWRASRQTIVSHKWAQARAERPPFWQRAFVDFLLLVPLAYGWFVLRRQGAVAPAGGPDPFANPLLFLLPSLFCAVFSLFFLRFLPRFMAWCALLAERLPGVTALLALRHMARLSGDYSGPLLLLGLTTSLVVFTASMARTLDHHLVETVTYQTGADVRLVEGAGGSGEDEAGDDAPRFHFLPVEEHLKAGGVRHAARVGDYEATANIGGRPAPGRLLGIDRLDFPAVAAFHPRFAAGESLGSLMNRLALAPEHLLVSRDFLIANNLQIGDALRLTVHAAGDLATIQFIVAGAFDRFPTYDPQQGPLFVAHLDTVHRGLGGLYPYDVWLATTPTATGEQIAADLRPLGIDVLQVHDSRQTLRAQRLQPTRQGLLGLLSTAFLAAALLAILGLLVYVAAGMRRRAVQLGLLRALGLSMPQMTGYLGVEQTLLVLSGLGLGVLLGAVSARVFIPYFQSGSGARAIIPFQVLLAWELIGLVSALFLLVLLLTIAMLFVFVWRLRLSEVVKLGEVV